MIEEMVEHIGSLTKYGMYWQSSQVVVMGGCVQSNAMNLFPLPLFAYAQVLIPSES